MKTALAGVIIIILVAIAGWYVWSTEPSSAPANTTTGTGPSTNAGVNGSLNQGNTGQPNSGQAQQPSANSSGAATPIIGANLALGINNGGGLGKYLIAYNGMTLYTYGNDTGVTSTCYGSCAQYWPPYTVSPSDNIHQLQAGVTGKVGTSQRTDGSLQLIYNGHPLYFYSGDKKSGDATGEGIDGVWYVVKP